MMKTILGFFLLIVTVITANYNSDETGLCVTQPVCPKARQGYGICCVPRNNITYLNYCLACNDGCEEWFRVPDPSLTCAQL